VDGKVGLGCEFTKRRLKFQFLVQKEKVEHQQHCVKHYRSSCFGDVRPCNLVEINQLFAASHCLHFQGRIYYTLKIDTAHWPHPQKAKLKKHTFCRRDVIKRCTCLRFSLNQPQKPADDWCMGNIKNTNHQQMHKESFIINCNTLLHVSTLVGHLQGELFVIVTVRLHFTVE
jgi:hypothetical protein